MTAKGALARMAVLAIATAMAAPLKPAAAADRFVFTYVERENDEAYRPHRAYTGLTLRTRHRPVDGAKTALRESKVLGRAVGVRFEMDVLRVGEEQDAYAAISDAMEGSPSRVFILDLPLDDMRRVTERLAGEDLLLFNPRHGDGILRNRGCAPNLFHTVPSRAMLMDGLSQYLRKKGWVRILVLEGEHEDDGRVSRAFARSAGKYGLNIVDTRTFKLGNDPRHRDRINVALLTEGDYDAVFLADSVGEFGRYVPYQTLSPRPVVGSEGLRASAWHWTWERHGAPQLNQRFGKRAKRRMKDADWAAWAAVKSVVEAVVRTKATDIPAIRAYLTSDKLNLDAYKGTPASFRPWNNQLRQPVLLHTHNAVIARAPLEEYLHRTHSLDTLGVDRENTACRME